MEKINVNPAYLDFIRYAIGDEKNAPKGSASIDWRDFLDYCSRQGIVGLVFDGIQRADLRIPQMTLFEWIGAEQAIEQQNAIINKRLIETVAFFDNRGLRSCILKGQANGLMYPQPELRSPGDVDIWVEGKREDIIKEVLKVCPDAHYSIHHIKLPVFEDVSVEVHYRPIYMANWYTDKKLQGYISRVEGKQFTNKVSFSGGEIGCLTDEFNVVYQMLHMYHHFFETRNNFKQFIDYYYLLKKFNVNHNDTLKDEIAERFKEFGVLKYAKGIMWVMKKILGLEEKCLVISPCEKEGRLILNESEYFGNFSADNLHLVIEKLWANFRVVSHYPKDVLISPLFLVWHQWWRLKMKLKLH